MKKHIFLIILISVVVNLVSCSDTFLTQDPQTSLSTTQVFSDLNNVQPYLDGLYFKWRDIRVNRKGILFMLGTDEMQQGEYQISTDAVQASFDKYDGFYDSQNSAIAQLWNVRWPVVVQASEAIAKLNVIVKTASSTDSVKIKSFIGQASFYRAALMFDLAQYWGELPIPVVTSDKITLSGRKPLKEVYTMIESDLLTAINNLNSSRSSDVRIPTKWAAKAILAKMYMSAQPTSGFRNFSKAKIQLLDIQNSGSFSLVSNFADLWNPLKSVSSEEIYTFYFNNVWPDDNELQWYAGSRSVSSDPNCYLGGYDLGLPTSYCYNDAAMGGIWETGDVRKTESIRYDFTYNGKAPAPVSGFGDDQVKPHIKKFEDLRLDGVKSFYYSGKNIYYIRYADVLLMLAECLNEEGSTSQAVNLVNNSVRLRAWGGTLPVTNQWNSGMSQDEFRTKILDERMRELCFEGWRRIDLIRTGHFVDYISNKNPWAKASGTININHMRYPIPLVEIKQNPNLSTSDQNPGFQ